VEVISTHPGIDQLHQNVHLGFVLFAGEQDDKNCDVKDNEHGQHKSSSVVEYSACCIFKDVLPCAYSSGAPCSATWEIKKRFFLIPTEPVHCRLHMQGMENGELLKYRDICFPDPFPKGITGTTTIGGCLFLKIEQISKDIV
jgi:hypothetical protein